MVRFASWLIATVEMEAVDAFDALDENPVSNFIDLRCANEGNQRNCYVEV